MGLSKIRLRDAAKAIPLMLVILAGLPDGTIRAQTMLAQAGATNISGNWFDAYLASSRITIVQTGSEFSFTGGGVGEDPPFAGIPAKVFGSGNIIGNSLGMNFTVSFQTGPTFTGHCSGVLRRSDVIAWRCRDNNNAENRPVWIRE